MKQIERYQDTNGPGIRNNGVGGKVIKWSWRTGEEKKTSESIY